MGLARHGSRHAGEPKILSCSFRLPRKSTAKGSIAQIAAKCNGLQTKKNCRGGQFSEKTQRA
jgi:hypothetical protein